VNSSDVSSENPQRVGLLLIHGIGDQAQGEHLRNIAGALAAAAKTSFGDANVTLTTYSPYRPQAHATIIIRYEDRSNTPQSIVVDIREAWWRNLAENPTISSVARFWWWAITFCAQIKHIPKDNSDNLAPRSETVREARVPFRLRVQMFLKTSAFFIILLPLHVAFEILSVVPLFQRVHFLRTVFAYLNSVRIYQEPKDTKTTLLENLFQTRRLSILRKTILECKHFAEVSAYQRWYIMGHSLGSVIAHNILNLSPHALARLLPFWEASTTPTSKFYCPVKVDLASDALSENTPAHLVCLPEKYGISPIYFFRNLRGVITYGSPLQTFAEFWPQIVMTRRDLQLGRQFEWINLYDPRDVVAAPIRDLPPLAGSAPTNISVSCHPLITSAHTAYLSSVPGRSGHRVAQAIVDWIVNSESTLSHHLQARGIAPNTATADRSGGKLRAAQVAAVIIIGALFLPRVLDLVGASLFYVGQRLGNLFTQPLANAIDEGCGDNRLCHWLATVLGMGSQHHLLLYGAQVFSVIFVVILLLLVGGLSSRLRNPVRQARVGEDEL
jgi:hypothetical protein